MYVIKRNKRKELTTMTTITITNIDRHYTNFGMHAEQALAYTLTGDLRKHDKVPFTQGSDIPEFEMSVKSAKFSLMNGNLCESQEFDGIVNEFFAKTASSCFAYVTQGMACYVMNADEFRTFVNLFCSLSRESTKNGGRCKVQMRSESKKVIQWLQMAVA
jgi:hypothetical protein